MNFQRNNNNMCEVASYAYYPTVAKSSSATTVAPIPTTVKPTVAPTAAPTTVMPKTTISSKPICYNGNGIYANPGCQSYYNCTVLTSQGSCPTGYLVNFSAQTCQIASQVVCNPSSYICSNGAGMWYPNKGCQTAYYCSSKTINTITCPTGKSYNPSTS